ncbi:MAG: NAD-dependent epimerase/dehydratase family protein, partial [Deltaproteobacteria bacterium]
TYAAVIPRFVTALLSGARPVIYGDGKQSRDFTYVENVVEANIKACFAPKEACGRAYNIACGERYSLLDLIAHLEEIIGVKADPVFEPERPGDVKHSQGDISLARKYLGYEVKVGFREGLERTVAWYRERVKS